jgi:dsDNA-binding SOS-regulon protein
MYKKMLELCDLQKLPSSGDKRNINVDMGEILTLFSGEEKSKIEKILEENKRLPQEIVNYRVLSKEMK